MASAMRARRQAQNSWPRGSVEIMRGSTRPDPRRKLFAIFLLGASAFLVSTGCSLSVTTTPPAEVAEEDLSGLVRAAELIVVGRIVSVQPGRAAGEGEARLQFNDVLVDIENQLKGEVRAPVTIEQVDTSGRVFSSEVGPPYRTGERYLLFLVRGEGNRYISIVNGRFLARSGRVRPVQSRSLAGNPKEMEEERFLQRIKRIVSSGQ